MHKPSETEMRTEQPRRRRKKRRSRLMSFIRAYLMAVGALTTLYVLFRLLIFFLVEVARVA